MRIKDNIQLQSDPNDPKPSLYAMGPRHEGKRYVCFEFRQIDLWPAVTRRSAIEETERYAAELAQSEHLERNRI